MGKDVQIRHATEEEIKEAHWVRRHREGNKRKTTSQFEHANEIMSSGMGTACIEGESWDEVNSALQIMRNDAAVEGFSLQSVEISGSGGTKFLVRKIQNPGNFINRDEQDKF